MGYTPVRSPLHHKTVFLLSYFIISFCSVLSDYLQKRNKSVPKSGKITFFLIILLLTFFRSSHVRWPLVFTYLLNAQYRQKYLGLLHILTAGTFLWHQSPLRSYRNFCFSGKGFYMFCTFELSVESFGLSSRQALVKPDTNVACLRSLL